VREEPLKALIGHTPIEVLAGSIIGTVIALFVTAGN
jgi:acid phosphatase family membrane protein YuiD